ncbi:uncharacterized protein LOC125254555 [Megalobrama amblycephala]|uniref:uncharacterized protein LOC125254555 n=1 Tax=Megalobrama amblycephala TaxID=75352 RepID=UPI00201412AF|nr:uncharacterized protein LOC125254555 [Megalobrama amblycephala]
MKNGPARRDITFKKARIEMDNSGNYSCVFSEEELEISKVVGYGHNYIFINVIESLMNSQIHLLKSEVAVGSDAEFNCTTSSPTNLSNNMILAFLIKNEKPIKVNIWDTEEMMTAFTLREVRMEDAGTYSCAILLNILPYHGMRLDRNNKVNLQIVVASYSSFDKIIIVIMCSTIVLLLSLFLGIWAVIRKRGCLGFHKERSLNETELRVNNVFYKEIPKLDTADTEEIRTVVCYAAVWEESSDGDALYDALVFQQS